MIVIEGGDGLGKSTQVKILENRLLSLGLPVAQFDFPNKSGTPIGTLIGDFLQGRFGEVTPEFLGLAFAADRLAARDDMIRELETGSIVICDRYVASNIAFQGAKVVDPKRRTRLHELFRWVEYNLYKLPQPDLEIALVASDKYYRDGTHLERAACQNRDYIKGGADIHESSLELQCAVNDYFIQLTEKPQLLKIHIEHEDNERRSIEELAQVIWASVEQKILGEKR